MSLTAWALAALTVVAGALCALALLDEWHGPAPKRTPQHGRWVGEGDTRRLSSAEMPTKIIEGAVSRGRCACLHLAHIGRCRAAECSCVSPEGFTAPGQR